MKSNTGSAINFFLKKMIDLIKSKEALGLAMRTFVHLSFDGKIVNEKELRAMFDDAITTYKKK